MNVVYGTSQSNQTYHRTWTKEELEFMPIAKVRIAARDKYVRFLSNTTKEELIDAILNKQEQMYAYRKQEANAPADVHLPRGIHPSTFKKIKRLILEGKSDKQIRYLCHMSSDRAVREVRKYIESHLF